MADARLGSSRRALLGSALGAAALGLMPQRARAAGARGATVKVSPCDLHLRHAWTLSRNSSSVKHNLVVTLTCDGISGQGEAAPNVRFHETTESARAALQRAAPILAALHPSQHVELNRRLRQALPDAPSARCALDVALWDWNARALGAPLYRVLGLSPLQAPPTSFSLGIAPRAELHAKVREAAAYPLLKIKLGAKPAEGISDREIIQAVRAAAPGKRLRIDPNEGWTLAQAREHLAWLAALPGVGSGPLVELCEQPLPAADLAGLRALHRGDDGSRAPLPILLDESVLDAGQIPRLVDAADGVVIKLQKAGGISPALEQITVARALGLKVMLGCMIESSLGITAAAHLAALCDYVDLDGHLLVADDPFRGVSVVAEEGRLRLPGVGADGAGGLPGLGVVAARAM